MEYLNSILYVHLMTHVKWSVGTLVMKGIGGTSSGRYMFSPINLIGTTKYKRGVYPKLEGLLIIVYLLLLLHY